MNESCNNCGNKLSADDDFCGECGTKSIDKSTPSINSQSIHTNYAPSISFDQETSDTTVIPLYKKLLAPIVFDKSTIKFIGQDTTGNFNAMILFSFNYYYMITFFIFNRFEFNLSGRRIEFLLMITGLQLLFLLFSLHIISWSYAGVLTIVNADHKSGEIFRLACYSSNWIAIGTTLAYFNSDYSFINLLTIVFPYLYLFSFIYNVSIYTDRGFIPILLLGVLVALMTMLLGIVFIIVILFLLFFLLFA
ncbi:MAG: hypothetical protein HeimC2_09660 [Candidatus Heimdallarchaeota archaeon LC_2]|nr:MAG: hypothetical protein HeimC2_09660 [Candidatus Heimdallarchaeota archaeon LC_2]